MAYDDEYKFVSDAIPKPLKNGEKVIAGTKKDLRKREEDLLIISLVTNMPLFGHLFAELRPDYFWEMPNNSGVLVTILTPTNAIVEEATSPGDIDILIIPYEGNKLVVEYSVACEVKAVRAKFTNQGKSPNQFGLSQSKAIAELGFPFVALIHLIVSDKSPRSAFQKIGVAKVTGSEGKIELLENQFVDKMPIHLLERNFGKLKKIMDPKSNIGAACVYLGSEDDDLTGKSGSIYMPYTQAASKNPKMSRLTILALRDYFEKIPEKFINLPRHSS